MEEDICQHGRKMAISLSDYVGGKVVSPEFTRDDIKSANLRKQFDRLWEKVSARYSLEKEGSNLSALPDSWDSIPEYEKTLYNLIVQKLNAKQEKEALSAKDLARQK